jgi:hypothetical protein
MMLGLLLAALAALPGGAPAQAPGRDTGTAPPPEADVEGKERESLRRCAVALCGALHDGKPAEGHVRCNLQKTWRKEAVDSLLARAKMSWPWGEARCVADLELDRGQLARAMQGPELELQLDAHAIRCQIVNGAETLEVTLQLKPRVTFRRGKVAEARLGWGRIEGPEPARSALWSLAAADNAFGLLRSAVVEDINGLIGAGCMEAPRREAASP